MADCNFNAYRPYRDELTCARKRAYYSKRDAKKNIPNNRRKFLMAYQCTVCGNWHVGHSRWRPVDGGKESV